MVSTCQHCLCQEQHRHHVLGLQRRFEESAYCQGEEPGCGTLSPFVVRRNCREVEVTTLKPKEMFAILDKHANSRTQTTWNLIPSDWVAMGAPPRERALSLPDLSWHHDEGVKVK